MQDSRRDDVVDNNDRVKPSIAIFPELNNWYDIFTPEYSDTIIFAVMSPAQIPAIAIFIRFHCSHIAIKMLQGDTLYLKWSMTTMEKFSRVLTRPGQIISGSKPVAEKKLIFPRIDNCTVLQVVKCQNSYTYILHESTILHVNAWSTQMVLSR